MIKLKRAYQTAEESDGVRVLVDGLWPRGVTKERAAIDWWAKELAPSPELRRWFGHVPERFPEFKTRFEAEVRGTEPLAKLRRLAESQVVTLVFGAKDTEHNQAVVLAELVAAASSTS